MIMNLSSEKQVSFNDGQIAWNYIFLIIAFFVIIFNNGLVLVASFSQKRLAPLKNIIIIASLSTTHLVSGLLLAPSSLVLVNSYPDEVGLKFAAVVTAFCGASSNLHFVLLCLERYIALQHPTKYCQINRGMLFLGTAVAWCLSVIGSTMFLADFKNYSIFLVVTFFIIPLLVDISVFAAIYCMVYNGAKTTLFKKELRLANAFGIMILIFSILWSPYMIIIILADHCSSCDIPNSHIFLLMLYCQVCSLCFSSCVYYHGSYDFRLAFKTIGKDLWCLFCKEQRNDLQSQVKDKSLASKVDGNTSQVNLALHMDGGAQRSPSIAESEPRALTNKDTAEKSNNGNDVNIVPFDQTKYFGEDTEERRGIDEGEEGSPPPVSLEMVDYDDISGEDIESWFTDIDIVPYDQTF